MFLPGRSGAAALVLPLPLPKRWPLQARKVLLVSACLAARGRVKGR